MIKKYKWIATGILVATVGCSAPRIGDFSSQHSLGTDIPTAQALRNTSGRVIQPDPTGVLTLRQALGLALLKSPSLEAQAWAVRAAEAQILQAGLMPNPEIEIEIDEYDHEGAGMDSSTTAIVLGQVIELGGKRRWRKRIARTEGELAGWEYESKRLDVFTETTKRFINVLAAQRQLDLAITTVELTKKTTMAVTEQVKAGKEPPLQASKADAELEMARLNAFAAEKNMTVAREKLATSWGSDQATFKTAKGDLNNILPALPDFDRLREHLPQNPDLAKWDTELKLHKANLKSEKAGRIPDIEISAGILSFEEDGTDALTFGIGIPLPLFDRNQGNVAAAKYNLAKARAERKAAQNTIIIELTEKYIDLTVSHKKAIILKNKVVPARTKAFESTHEGYQQGKFGFLDVLDAQRGLFTARADLLDALSNYHTALIDIQRITGTSIEELSENKKEKKQ
ncbi:MAG: TolC family protein [Kiritimatiellae bacterium]|nr:TolC family protein [Kiritimatiellia bacterium]